MAEVPNFENLEAQDQPLMAYKPPGKGKGREARRDNKPTATVGQRLADAAKGIATTLGETVGKVTPTLGGNDSMDKGNMDLAQNHLKIIEDHLELVRQASTALQEDTRYHKKYLDDLIQLGKSQLEEQKQINVFVDRATRILEVQIEDIKADRLARWLSMAKDGLAAVGIAWFLWHSKASAKSAVEVKRPPLQVYEGGR